MTTRYISTTEGWTAFLYTLAGTVLVGGAGASQTSVEAHHTVTLHRTGSGVEIEAASADVSFVLICGQPHNEVRVIVVASIVVVVAVIAGVSDVIIGVVASVWNASIASAGY
jgi:redox-sensitive bicupin YhaK (pirin superfamily)